MNRRTGPCLAFNVSPFVETSGAEKMPRIDFSKRQVPRAPVEPLRIPLETWPSSRLARALGGSVGDGRRPTELSLRRAPARGTKPFEHSPTVRALEARSVFDGWRHAPAGPEGFGLPAHPQRMARDVTRDDTPWLSPRDAFVERDRSPTRETVRSPGARFGGPRVQAKTTVPLRLRC